MTITSNLFCQCGYREDAHTGETKRCPLADGIKTPGGGVQFRSYKNPGLTFVPSVGANATGVELSGRSE